MFIAALFFAISLGSAGGAYAGVCFACRKAEKQLSAEAGNE